MDFEIENRQIKPAVYPINQNENDTTVLKFTFANYIHDDAVDLRNYIAYAVTSINGQIDMTELESAYDASSDTLIVTWNVQEYTLRLAGAIQYQIVFKEDSDDGENTGVYYTNKAILLNRTSINADDHITANYPTLLKQWLDRMSTVMGGESKAAIVYISYGETISPAVRSPEQIYWQWDNAEKTAGHFEDNGGNELDLSQCKDKTKYLPNQDLLGDMTNSADQHYITAGASIKNAPISNSYCLVKQYDTESTNRFIQEVQVPDNNNVVRTFVRCVTGHAEHGVEKVGAWRELTTNVELDAAKNNLKAEINNVKAEIKIAMPAGSVIAFAGSSTPEGYLLCNGAAVSRTTYAELFAAIGTTYGKGDGSKTFNLPNLTDKFIQGNATVGTVKSAGLPDHKHDIGFDHYQGGEYGAKSITKTHASSGYGNAAWVAKSSYTSNASTSNSIYGKSDTVQPPAVTMRYCIKY